MQICVNLSAVVLTKADSWIKEFNKVADSSTNLHESPRIQLRRINSWIKEFNKDEQDGQDGHIILYILSIHVKSY